MEKEKSNCFEKNAKKYEYEKLQIELKLTQRELKHKENQRVKEVALLEQKIELQKNEIHDLKSQQQTQKDLYDTMVRSINAINGPSTTEQECLSMIKDLKEKHERQIIETVSHYTQKCDKLYTYIKESERMQDDLESQWKTQKRELKLSHQMEMENLQEKYKKQISKIKKKLVSKTKEATYRSDSVSKIQQVTERNIMEIEQLRQSVANKDLLLRDNNDQITCLNNKIHGLRTIISELRVVEQKYSQLLERPQFSTETFEVNNPPCENMYMDDCKRKATKSCKKVKSKHIKTSRGIEQMNIYDEQSVSKQSTKKGKKKKKHGNLKINIKENNPPGTVVPQSTQGHTNMSPLMQNYTFQEKMKHQEQNLVERMNRIESIITSRNSFDRLPDKSYRPLLSQNDYNYDYSVNYAVSTRRGTVSPLSSHRMTSYNTANSSICPNSSPKRQPLPAHNQMRLC
ncbi:unnamed protein product [Moneuplotes crassus]|uniref:Uncharacterized protein n=1 Tax=Euplotes crassus TaxID=5936 RepID=A0AAD1X6E3_EUPCR|nr:unnamed protein product [Moneuplotes crassus]